MKILIAEDDPIMLAYIARQLKSENYEIFSTTDGQEALEKLDSFSPDLIVTDILMPMVSGLDVIGIVRSNPLKKIPILVLSGIDEEETVLEAFSIGADDFITKPFKPQELSMRVKRLLGNKK